MSWDMSDCRKCLAKRWLRRQLKKQELFNGSFKVANLERIRIGTSVFFSLRTTSDLPFRLTHSICSRSDWCWPFLCRDISFLHFDQKQIKTKWRPLNMKVSISQLLMGIGFMFLIMGFAASSEGAAEDFAESAYRITMYVLAFGLFVAASIMSYVERKQSKKD